MPAAKIFIKAFTGKKIIAAVQRNGILYPSLLNNFKK
jgi:hypothetical protein